MKKVLAATLLTAVVIIGSAKVPNNRIALANTVLQSLSSYEPALGLTF